MNSLPEVSFGTFLSSTALAGFGGFMIREIFKRVLHKKEESRNISSAFVGEIGAILDIIKKRKIIKIVEDAMERTRDGTVEYPEFTVKDNYFNVYKASIPRLGLLSAPLPAKIATFYTYLMSIAEDFNYMASIDKEKLPEIPINKALAEMAAMLELLKDAILMGENLIENL